MRIVELKQSTALHTEPLQTRVERTGDRAGDVVKSGGSRRNFVPTCTRARRAFRTWPRFFSDSPSPYDGAGIEVV